jgi:hypothetical protein
VYSESGSRRFSTSFGKVLGKDYSAIVRDIDRLSTSFFRNELAGNEGLIPKDWVRLRRKWPRMPNIHHAAPLAIRLSAPNRYCAACRSSGPAYGAFIFTSVVPHQVSEIPIRREKTTSVEVQAESQNNPSFRARLPCHQIIQGSGVKLRTNECAAQR